MSQKVTTLWPTTSDNPYNPFTQGDEWSAFDHQNGYNTAEYMARIGVFYEDMTELESIYEQNRIAKEIYRLNLTGNYELVNSEVSVNV